MKPLILATAGHIDHGKTALVQALTGVDTDRLPEEKQRGITIDLGFANLRLGDLSFGVVDVPGHEGFIRNMLAGATGMDAVLLVIAADEGVMPQTREHLAILDLLAVRCGVVVITKCDLVSEDWLDLVVDDVRQLLDATTLSGAPIITVSAKTGEGIDQLRAAISEQASRPNPRRPDDLFRLPIDRVFTVRGTGTVVTGTVWSGTVSVDQTVMLRPSGKKTRVRGVEVHGRAVDAARAGERAALALAGVAKETVERGDVVVDSPIWVETRMLLVRARLIADTTWALKARQRVRVHVGTAEVIGRAVLLDKPTILAGMRGWIQLRLEEPVLARAGDKIVIRSYSPVTTIGGGVVAELSERKRPRIDMEEAATLESIIDCSPPESIAAALLNVGTRGATLDELSIMTPVARSEVAAAVGRLPQTVIRIGSRCFASDVVEGLIQSVIERVKRQHALNPLRPALERAEICGGIRNVPAELVEYSIDAAVERGALTASGANIAASGFEPVLSDRQNALKTALLDALKQGGISPPTVTELGRSLGNPREVQRLLRVLEHEGVVQPVSQEMYIELSALMDAQERTQASLGGATGLTATEFRTALPVSRKHLIPLLEYFDRAGITVRDGDLRRVIPASDAS